MKHLHSLLVSALVLAASAAFADGSDIVFAAIQYGDLESLRAVLAENSSLAGVTNASGMMPLHFAARIGQADAAGILLDAGADPNAPLAKSAGTPLHYAANVDAAEIAKLLLAKGAKTEAKAVNGRTPLHFAAAKGNEASIKVLLGAGADPNAADPQGQTPLHLAAAAGHASAVRALLGGGADPEIPNGEGAVPCEADNRRRLYESELPLFGVVFSARPDVLGALTEADFEALYRALGWWREFRFCSERGLFYYLHRYEPGCGPKAPFSENAPEFAFELNACMLLWLSAIADLADRLGAVLRQHVGADGLRVGADRVGLTVLPVGAPLGEGAPGVPPPCGRALPDALGDGLGHHGVDARADVVKDLVH